MNSPSGRRLAQLVLDRVELEDAYVNLALQDVLKEYQEIDRRERAFCTDLVYGALRNLLNLDYILGRLLSRPLPSLKVPVKNVLRLALYQLIFLPEIPERAVCHSAVEEIKHSKYVGLANLVNGVLRNYLRTRAKLEFPKREQDLERFLSLTYSHPLWLVKRWLTRFGPELTEQLLKIDNEQPPLTLRVNQHHFKLTDVVAELTKDGVVTAHGLLLPEALIIKELPQPLNDLAGFQKGQFFMQDESSMLVAHSLQPLPNELIIDLCAAPGGKSTHLAELSADGARIISVDNHPHKVELIAANAKRLGLTSIQPTLGDATSFTLEAELLADAVLVDAPCSGTGVLRRRVDARYRRQPGDIIELAKLQREILNQAAGLVKPKGRLIYSTCTLEAEENEAQVEWFLGQHPEYFVADCKEFLPDKVGDLVVEKEKPWATILPVSSGGDGFFICRFEKKS